LGVYVTKVVTKSNHMPLGLVEEQVPDAKPCNLRPGTARITLSPPGWTAATELTSMIVVGGIQLK
jgi:hypothetical protein